VIENLAYDMTALLHFFDLSRRFAYDRHL
jgi:hypothetical protein